MPAHFTKIDVALNSTKEGRRKYEEWILKNTDGRFAIESIVTNTNPMVTKLVIAFEDSKEALYFRLQFSS